MACFEAFSLRRGARAILPVLLVAGIPALAQDQAPSSPQALLSPRTGEQVYQTVCMRCHDTGEDKAPKLGDRKAWAPRLKEGQVDLTAEGWTGVRKMPARGGESDLSLEEFSSAVVYMARAAGAPWTDPDAKMLERIRKVEAKRLKKQQAPKS